MIGIFNWLFSKRAGAPQGDTRSPESFGATPETKTDKSSNAQQTLTEDAKVASAQQWVRDKLQSGDFRALAAMSSTCTRDNWYQFHAANKALRDAGPLVVEAMVEELELDF